MGDIITFCLIAIPAMPLGGAILITLLGVFVPRLRGLSHVLSIGSIAISFLFSLWLLNEVRRDAIEFERVNHSSKLADTGFEKTVTLWTWMSLENAYRSPSAADTPDPGIRNLQIDVTLRADALTAVMLCMVTFVATLVAMFAAGYMQGDEGYWRFFAFVGLFVFSMTMLVSVSNFLLLFVFWEAVGVCSYLLIGFWSYKPEAAEAGMKAFLVNRVGDFGFTLALFLIWVTYGTLNFHDTLTTGEMEFTKIEDVWVAEGAQTPTQGATSDSPKLVRGVLGRTRIATNGYVHGAMATAICLLLMLGACGKSAQFPLHVWLPDAMEGPTPVSALIHAATMVTAGVYMVARCTPLFVASPNAQLVVAIVGAITSILAALIALTQHDLKRVLAYSTISQLGYMFLGLGAGSFLGITGAMFHLFTHAFFKALLFLGSGSVMHAMGHIIDMRRFSGLRRIMPATYATFLIGSLTLAGVAPFAGFWSKDQILASLHEKAHDAHEASHDETVTSSTTLAKVYLVNALVAESQGHTAGTHSDKFDSGRIYNVLYWLGLFTAFLTAFYTFRAMFLTFHGEEIVPPEAGDHAHESPPIMLIPLVVLMFCSVLAGVVFIPWFGQLSGNRFVEFIGTAPSLSVAATGVRPELSLHADVAGLSTVVAIGGILLALYLYMGDRSEAKWLQSAFDLRGLRGYADVAWVERWRQTGWGRVLDRVLSAVYLGAVMNLLMFVIGMIAIVLSAPFTLFTFVTPYRLSLQKFFFDELYTWMFVRPAAALGKLFYWIDRRWVDGLVDAVGAVPVGIGGVMRYLQVGLVQFYALAMLLGAIVMLVAHSLFGK